MAVMENPSEESTDMRMFSSANPIILDLRSQEAINDTTRREKRNVFLLMVISIWWSNG